MGALVDLVGQTFGHLEVLARSSKLRSTGALWECRCACGNTSTVDSLKLRTGKTKSCGCQQNSGVQRLRHGHSRDKTPTYRTWKEMRQRCTNPESDQWKWYGGRGISICARWDVFENFLEDMGERPTGKTLDRRNSDGDYSKSNCRWATPKEQAATNRGTFKPGATPHNKGGLRTVEKVKGAA